MPVVAGQKIVGIRKIDVDGPHYADYTLVIGEGMSPANRGITQMSYSIFSLLLVSGEKSFRLEISAVSLQAAMADVDAAYDDVLLVQWSHR
jgi:hypothetical protein